MSSPNNAPTFRRLAAGFGLGVAACVAAVILASLVPSRLPAPPVEDLRLYQTVPGSGVSVSFIDTGSAPTAGWLLHQGGGLARRDVTFRAAFVEHPNGNLLFGTGIDPDGPGGGVFDPFGRVRSNPRPVGMPEIERVFLPSPRWFHMGGLDSWPMLVDTPVVIAAGDLWQATSGPWPRRYGIERARVAELDGRIERLAWTNRPHLGLPRSVDVFGDSSVIAIALKGSSIDEIALLLTLDSGRRMLLVGDTVWTTDQVEERFARGLWSTWLLDRNRMQLASMQRRLHQAWRDYGLEIVPLLDPSVSVAEWPERWR